MRASSSASFRVSGFLMPGFMIFFFVLALALVWAIDFPVFSPVFERHFPPLPLLVSARIAVWGGAHTHSVHRVGGWGARGTRPFSLWWGGGNPHPLSSVPACGLCGVGRGRGGEGGGAPVWPSPDAEPPPASLAPPRARVRACACAPGCQGMLCYIILGYIILY